MISTILLNLVSNSFPKILVLSSKRGFQTKLVYGCKQTHHSINFSSKLISGYYTHYMSQIRIKYYSSLP